MSEPAAMAPSTSLFFFRSSRLFTGTSCHTNITCGCCAGEPSQFALLTSNGTLPSGDISRSRDSSGTLLVVSAITVPSRGALLNA